MSSDIAKAAGALLQELTALKLDPMHPVSIMAAGLAFAVLDEPEPADDGRYTIEAGRGILRDGKLIGRISGSSRHGEYVSPTDLDSLTRRIADLLNQYGE